MIRFLSPEWLFVLPALGFIAWKFRALKLTSPLRATCLILLVLALTRPIIRSGDSGMDIWMLVDRSHSTGELPMKASEELESILQRNKRKNDNVFTVDFGKEAVRRDKGDAIFGGGQSSSRLGSAIDFVLAQTNPEQTTRMLVLTDGFPTDSLENAATKLKNSGISLDYRLFDNNSANDCRVSDISIPSRVGPGESFLLEFDIYGNPNAQTQVPWSITRGNAPPLKGSATLVNGKAHVKLRDRVLESGGMRYTAEIAPPNDPVMENNKATGWVEITGGNKVLLISRYTNDPIIPYLKAQGFPVNLVTNPSSLTPDALIGTRIVIINDVACSEIPMKFLRSIDFFVNGQGGGLLMCGGKNSFGSGGYFHSPIDKLLPVSMELRKDENKLMAAIAFVLDRSGSMAMSTPNGKTKIELAAQGTANAIEMLGDQDYVSVHAVDTEPHAIYTMSKMGEHRHKILNATRRIESLGGGIYIEEGLAAGWRQLKKTEIGTRHLILFADASDSRQHPGEYRKILQEMKDGGTTVSVIAMGTNSDCDADLLKDVATRGEGRIFFSDNPMDLPNIFAQETVSIARSAFITDPTPLQATHGWSQISGTPIAWPRQIEAFNLSYLKEGATAACLSKDSYEAPLVAFWPRGSGRTASISFPMAGAKASHTLDWPAYGEFLQTLTRWLAGNGMPDGFALKTNVHGERLDIELLYADRCVSQIARKMPHSNIEVISGGQPKIIDGTWEHIRPGVFRTSFMLDGGERVRGAISIGDQVIPFGPAGLSSNVEWNRQSAQKKSFLHTAKISGGKEQLDMADIWNSPRHSFSRELTLYLLWAFLALLITDSLLTRLGINLSMRKKRKGN